VVEGQALGGGLELAMTMAATMATMSTAALAAVLRCVDDAADLPLLEDLAREADRETELFDRHDGQEGIRAFLEKGTPDFA
jgi:enoyl-CoA hydratase/carnithine racemase